MDYPILIYNPETNESVILFYNEYRENKVRLSDPVQAFCLFYALLDYVLDFIGIGYEMGYSDAKEEDEGEEYWGDLM